MSYIVQLEEFEGPLDLLLKLIQKEELDICHLSLARVTDQYLDYLRQKGEVPIDELADFLVVAAQLIYLKTKAVLPHSGPPEELEEEEEGLSLTQRLAEYKRYKEAAEWMSAQWGKNRSFSRKFILKAEAVFVPGDNLTSEAMIGVLERVIGEWKWFIERELERGRLAKRITVAEKIDQLTLMIKRQNFSFTKLMAGEKGKLEVVTSFLALLELVKQRVVEVDQGGIFEEIKVQAKHNG